MRNIKKLLCLALAVAMALTLFVVPHTASAVSVKTVENYVDVASIPDAYLEYVDVLTHLGLFAGDGSGNFNGSEVLDRASAAKLVVYLLYGAENVESAVKSKVYDTFTDVPKSNWANPYVNIAYEEGIIKGYGDGTFGATDPVTYSQLALILLRALGYGKAGEFEGGYELKAIAALEKLHIGLNGYNAFAGATRLETAKILFKIATETYYVNYSALLGGYTYIGSADVNYGPGEFITGFWTIAGSIHDLYLDNYERYALYNVDGHVWRQYDNKEKKWADLTVVYHDGVLVAEGLASKIGTLFNLSFYAYTYPTSNFAIWNDNGNLGGANFSYSVYDQGQYLNNAYNPGAYIKLFDFDEDGVVDEYLRIDETYLNAYVDSYLKTVPAYTVDGSALAAGKFTTLESWFVYEAYNYVGDYAVTVNRDPYSRYYDIVVGGYRAVWEATKAAETNHVQFTQQPAKGFTWTTNVGPLSLNGSYYRQAAEGEGDYNLPLLYSYQAANGTYAPNYTVYTGKYGFVLHYEVESDSIDGGYQYAFISKIENNFTNMSNKASENYVEAYITYYDANKEEYVSKWVDVQLQTTAGYGYDAWDVTGLPLLNPTGDFVGTQYYYVDNEATTWLDESEYAPYQYGTYVSLNSSKTFYLPDDTELGTKDRTGSVWSDGEEVSDPYVGRWYSYAVDANGDYVFSLLDNRVAIELGWWDNTPYYNYSGAYILGDNYSSATITNQFDFYRFQPATATSRYPDRYAATAWSFAKELRATASSVEYRLDGTVTNVNVGYENFWVYDTQSSSFIYLDAIADRNYNNGALTNSQPYFAGLFVYTAKSDYKQIDEIYYIGPAIVNADESQEFFAVITEVNYRFGFANYNPAVVETYPQWVNVNILYVDEDGKTVTGNANIPVDPYVYTTDKLMQAGDVYAGLVGLVVRLNPDPYFGAPFYTLASTDANNNNLWDDAYVGYVSAPGVTLTVYGVGNGYIDAQTTAGNDVRIKLNAGALYATASATGVVPADGSSFKVGDVITVIGYNLDSVVSEISLEHIDAYIGAAVLVRGAVSGGYQRVRDFLDPLNAYLTGGTYEVDNIVG